MKKYLVLGACLALLGSASRTNFKRMDEIVPSIPPVVRILQEAPINKLISDLNAVESEYEKSGYNDTAKEAAFKQVLADLVTLNDFFDALFKFDVSGQEGLVSSILTKQGAGETAKSFDQFANLYKKTMENLNTLANQPLIPQRFK